MENKPVITTMEYSTDMGAECEIWFSPYLTVTIRIYTFTSQEDIIEQARSLMAKEI